MSLCQSVVQERLAGEGREAFTPGRDLEYCTDRRSTALTDLITQLSGILDCDWSMAAFCVQIF